MGRQPIGQQLQVISGKVGWWLWLSLLLVIPVTSSPWVASFSGGETPVSPLALFPLIGVVLLIIMPRIVQGENLPAHFWPLFIFLLFTLLSTSISVHLPLFEFKGQDLFDRILRGLLTLGIGICFYLAAIILPDSKQKIETSLRAIFLGLFLLLIWSSIQGWFVLTSGERVPLLVTRIHHIFSVRDPLPDRITGMAFEPSWLGDQLVGLYIPLLFASVVTRYSSFTSHRTRLSLELVLLVWSICILILTQSRISLFSLFAVISGIYFYLSARMIGQVARRVQPGLYKWALWFAAGIIVLALWIGLVIAAGWMLSNFDERMSYLLRVSRRLEEFRYFYPNEAIFALANRLAFAERLAYWTVGVRTFGLFPIFGVGAGNSGFFFDVNLPAFAYQLTEIQNVLSIAEFGFPNVKNLWLRLLAEGGIVGFASFMTWYMLVTFGAVVLWRKDTRLSRVLGLGGIIGSTTFFVEGFSLDTYALPHFWVLFGLISCGIHGLIRGTHD